MQTTPISDTRHDSPVLSFEDCVLALAGTHGETFSAQIELFPGELVLLHTEDSHHEDALTRAICGLLPPDSGAVKFREQDWRDLSSDQSNALRGRIGIVFRRECWIPYLPIMDSIILPQLHHTRRSYEAICREAMHWAMRFGLPGLPSDLPSAVSGQDRQCANLIQAFIGNPTLIIVEHQLGMLAPKLRGPLINAIREARERDAAVLWYTRDLASNLDEMIPATRHLRLGTSVACSPEPVA